MSRVLAGVSGIHRGVALGAGLVMAGGLALFATGAGAAPQPSVNQVQARINQLTSQFDKVSQQLDQAGQQLSAAQSRLSRVRHAAEQRELPVPDGAGQRGADRGGGVRGHRGHLDRGRADLG